MLPEPERQLVAEFIARGGVVAQIPFGVGAEIWSTRFAAAARSASRLGWLRRFGVTHLPAGCVAAFLDGRISIAGTRAPFVWAAAKGADGKPVSWIAHQAHCNRAIAELALQLLARINCAERIAVGAGGHPRWRATGAAAPHWSEFLDMTTYPHGNPAGGSARDEA